jgi:hypothetical protein
MLHVSQYKQRLTVYRINLLVLITGTEGVYRAVRTGSLNKGGSRFVPRSLNDLIYTVSGMHSRAVTRQAEFVYRDDDARSCNFRCPGKTQVRHILSVC